MSGQQRRERERSVRHQLIVTTARDLAEAEGWDAVTTRRLAERIEYSQPVLYSHFHGKDEIVRAVALEGFTELTAAIRRDVPTQVTPRAAVTALATTYIRFAEHNRAVYDAMFGLDIELPFADERTPAPLNDAFAALLDTFGDAAGDVEPGLFTEVGWAALHGLVTLTRAGRLPPQHGAERLAVLVDRLVGDSTTTRPRSTRSDRRPTRRPGGLT